MTDYDFTDTLADDPLWYKDAIVYQIHVKAFYDTNGDGTGDFRGLTQKLDYIRDLGVNTIWLLPFYPSPMRDDGYDISDYRNIHPPYGTRRDFRRFVGAAHRRGIRVITELVINHTSDQHPWFQAARLAPPGSKKRDFYVWSDDDRKFSETRIIFTDTESSNWAWDPEAGQYYWHRFFAHQPDLNHNNPDVVKAVIRVMRFWFDMGVDGVRLDAIPYLCVREGTSNENLPETHAVIRQMRAVVDAHYRNRMFLAEANQWPEDVREYFGDGDECHVAYHFPLMPRMYMAVAQEDRHPIVEIMDQTPEIPPSCQWAIFLRNHDELTLEMVSDRERDYMYQTYATDPRMRVNVGIRRRLAPLLDNDRDKIRLMHSLLLSMPGSPILYYGDEIGMGDNIYLGDRDGVRTPMQWSPDRNAGFSRADPQRLYLPPIMDPIYGYESVNVEAQSRSTSSLLNWMRRIIEVRKAHQVFGRGRLSFLHPGNRKILAYVRESPDAAGGEAVLCVANLGRGAQPVELDLARFQGRVPIELLGQTAFPPIGELPYLLTLSGYGFYWFLLSAEADAPHWHEERLPTLKLATLVIPEGWQSLSPEHAARLEPAERAVALLEQRILPEYLRTRRWYPRADAAIRRVELGQRQVWRDRLLTLLHVELSDGAVRDYFLPMVVLWERQGEDVLSTPVAGAALARVRKHAAGGLLCDAAADEAFARALIDAIGRGEEIPLGPGVIAATPTAAYERVIATRDSGSFRVPADGTNSIAVLGDRLHLKLYRRLRPGLGGEIEMGRFLTERTDFRQIATLAGDVVYRDGEGVPHPIAVLQQYVPNQGDLWSYTLSLLARLAEDHGAVYEDWQCDPAQFGYAALLETLGRRVAELHLALSAPVEDSAFAPEPVDAAELAGWREHARRDAQRTLQLAGECLAELPEAAATGLFAANLRRLLERRDLLDARLAMVTPTGPGSLKIRCHGNLVLRRVLVVENDVVLIGFGGSPSVPLGERRAKQSPLKDVAALLRSLHHAGAEMLEQMARERPTERQRLADPLRCWGAEMAQRLLAAYRQGVRGSSIEAAGQARDDALIRLFMIRMLLFEIRGALHAPAGDREGAAASLIGQLLAVLEEG